MRRCMFKVDVSSNLDVEVRIRHALEDINISSPDLRLISMVPSVYDRLRCPTLLQLRVVVSIVDSYDGILDINMGYGIWDTS